tara:strand:- start:567 stop:836 length:270 start_codon:yes stop_codon:yes gene_type:complete
MKISRMTKGEWGKIRAFFDVEVVEGVTAKGFKLIEGEKGLFVGNPSIKKEDGYEPVVFLEKIQYIALNKLANDYYKDGGDSREDDPIPF